MSVPLVLYHANCPDGFCAAWIAQRAMPGAECVPVQYGQEPPDVTGREVYIVDFSYKRPVMRQILSRAHKVVVLDHHKTAQAELADIVDEFVQRPDLIANPPGSHLPIVHFDMDKSGGRLAWEFFCTDPLSSWANCPVPWLVDYTEDRDLWRWELAHSRAVSAWLASSPMTFAAWSEYAMIHGDSQEWRILVQEGSAILRYQAQQVENISKTAREIDLGGHRIMAANTSCLFSEVAGKLAEDRPFGAAWFIRSDGKKQWSLRSRDGGVDVAEIAKAHGGGGHRNAAGFEEEP